MTTDIDIVLYDGFDELDAIGPYEVFRSADGYGGAIRAEMVTLEPRDLVTANHGLRVEPDGVLDTGDEDRADIVVVPGGGWNDRSEAGAWAEAQRGTIPDAVAGLYRSGAAVASVCTGGMLLAEAGLTDGRPAVTHADALDDLRDSGAEVVDARVVDDGDLLSAGGVTSGIDLALYLVERECGSDIADRVATVLEYDRTDEVFRSA